MQPWNGCNVFWPGYLEATRLLQEYELPGGRDTAVMNDNSDGLALILVVHLRFRVSPQQRGPPRSHVVHDQGLAGSFLGSGAAMTAAEGAVIMIHGLKSFPGD
jgi:hypothetical protein